MEFLEGEIAGGVRSPAGRPHGRRARRSDCSCPLLSAVAAGHAQGVVHRDLKPANIFSRAVPWGESVPKVLDFGVSKLIRPWRRDQPDRHRLGAGNGGVHVTGTGEGAQNIDGRSDQFALGQILYEMLTGARATRRQPVRGSCTTSRPGNSHPPRQRRPELLPVALEEILLRMMAFAPSD